MKKHLSWKAVLLISTIALGITACGSGQGSAPIATNSPDPAKEQTLEEIVNLAKQEGKVVSVGMPDDWANWIETWGDIKTKYGLSHTDTDLTSSEEIAKFDAEKNNPTADIGDVGIAFGKIAKEKGVTMPYKTSYWNDIPEWAKDKDGHYLVDYQGTIAVLIDKSQVKNPPKTWEDIEKGDYKVQISDVTKSSQAQMGVLASAIAHGGNEGNIEPGLSFFSKLAKQNRLVAKDPTKAALEKGEIPIAILWDFVALGFKDQIDPNRFEVNIMQEGSVIGGYTTIINKYAPHPNAAKLAREFILSDEGQINLAKGFARPIRDNVKLPEEIAKKMIPKEQYRNAKPITDYKLWDETSKKIPQLWQEQVLVHIK
ncbi:ABC transporter substrate-binding protein [Paenibacillus sp. Soil787]|uniref:ABC transporter substrate-binding protein n=1 Tax=Paenibacillus sp. Soil787 TaxID=1736411 RepID=UPI0006FB5F5B|nr:extracellular solute-binding protein [Paenibacillus sp. Soil787]KRF42190.1 ABC transporter substrate-binding protein [Paenibacillus sp. Soil787]